MKRNSYFLLIGLIFLSACTQTGSTSATATAEPTSTPLSVSMPVRPDFDSAEGISYSPDQIQAIESGAFETQEEMLTKWWTYWVKAKNNPFDTSEVPTFVYFWDEDGTPGGVLLRTKAAYYGHMTYYMPIWNENFLEVPPDTKQEEYDIPVGMGPLELSGGDYVLAWADGQWARVDENGEIMERINMETAQWEKEKFLTLLPETLKKVRETNVLRWNHLEEDLAMLIAKEKQEVINIDDIDPFDSGISGRDIKKYRLPSIIPLEISDKNSIISFSYLEKENEGEIYIIGIATKRRESDNVGILHFAIDLNTSENYNSLLNLNEDYFNSTYNLLNTYQKIINGDFSYLLIETILWRGYAEEGGIWDPLLSLDPERMESGSEFTMTINFGINGSSDEELEKESFEKLQKMIIPTVSVGVIY